MDNVLEVLGIRDLNEEANNAIEREGLNASIYFRLGNHAIRPEDQEKISELDANMILGETRYEQMLYLTNYLNGYENIDTTSLSRITIGLSKEEWDYFCEYYIWAIREKDLLIGLTDSEIKTFYKSGKFGEGSAPESILFPLWYLTMFPPFLVGSALSLPLATKLLEKMDMINEETSMSRRAFLKLVVSGAGGSIVGMALAPFRINEGLVEKLMVEIDNSFTDPDFLGHIEAQTFFRDRVMALNAWNALYSHTIEGDTLKVFDYKGKGHTNSVRIFNKGSRYCIDEVSKYADKYIQSIDDVYNSISELSVEEFVPSLTKVLLENALVFSEFNSIGGLNNEIKYSFRDDTVPSSRTIVIEKIKEKINEYNLMVELSEKDRNIKRALEDTLVNLAKKQVEHFHYLINVAHLADPAYLYTDFPAPESVLASLNEEINKNLLSTPSSTILPDSELISFIKFNGSYRPVIRYADNPEVLFILMTNGKLVRLEFKD